jgi:hypothetical protein
VKVNVRKTFGKDGSHLRLLLKDKVGGIFWRGVQHYRSHGLKDAEVLDVVYRVEWDDFSGKPVVSVRDLGRLFQ